jgi:hypothetical protein
LTPFDGLSCETRAVECPSKVSGAIGHVFTPQKGGNGCASIRFVSE